MSQKTDWEAARQRANLIRKTLLQATDKEGAIGRLLDLGYSAEELQAQIARIGTDALHQERDDRPQ